LDAAVCGTPVAAIIWLWIIVHRAHRQRWCLFACPAALRYAKRFQDFISSIISGDSGPSGGTPDSFDGDERRRSGVAGGLSALRSVGSGAGSAIASGGAASVASVASFLAAVLF
jgi:hypothetical protein